MVTIVPWVFWLSACSTGNSKPAGPSEYPSEVSLKGDQAKIEALRKGIPLEVKKENDQLKAELHRWKVGKTKPEVLRSRFRAGISKLRQKKSRQWKRMRKDFSRQQKDERTAFYKEQKKVREKFLSTKPESEARSEFRRRQGEERDRFRADQRAYRDQFNADLRDKRKAFQQEMKDRWTEFRQEYPEYQRNYKLMKAAEKQARDRRLRSPYTGWPYQNPGEKPLMPGEANYDVNKGGDGWPSSNPKDFDRMKGKGN